VTQIRCAKGETLKGALWLPHEGQTIAGPPADINATLLMICEQAGPSIGVTTAARGMVEPPGKVCRQCEELRGGMPEAASRQQPAALRTKVSRRYRCTTNRGR
jgi:hypothetical protein